MIEPSEAAFLRQIIGIDGGGNSVTLLIYTDADGNYIAVNASNTKPKIEKKEYISLDEYLPRVKSILDTMIKEK